MMSNVFPTLEYVGFSKGCPTLPAWFRSMYFAVCCTVIGLISCYDMLLVFVHSETIFEMEKNPICLALLKMEPTFFSYFVIGKTLGTITVLGVLVHLFRNRFHSWHCVTSGITLFQLGLLAYLTYA
ncbi:hypothetical protein Rcae01_03166 [Novipirellula caenicola]|uniref:DUF5658 domain-containing protein n=2 Tax=Novipirellula caenicola TaxID=1536901 RepID=A0ABP9VRB3_9BACT